MSPEKLSPEKLSPEKLSPEKGGHAGGRTGRLTRACWQVNPQLKGHLKGALNGGATVDEEKAVRSVVLEICEAAGMQLLDASAPAGCGWHSEVADL